MKLKLLSILVLLSSIIACTPENKKQNESQKEQDIVAENNNGKYPEKLWKVFKSHGGINNWKQQQSLSFSLGEEEEKIQHHTIDLWTRQSVFKGPGYAVGNDGTNIWVQEDTAKFKGNAGFYYNLMFYFYAMPFVLGDEGINYQEIEPVTLLDKEYHGFRISYEANVGESPDDEYIVYYDPETNKMEWLAYTVTFFSKKKAKRFSLIHYEEWAKTGDFLLPTKLQWYKFENNQVGEKRGSTAIYSEAKLSKEPTDKTIFKVPQGATIVK